MGKRKRKNVTMTVTTTAIIIGVIVILLAAIHGNHEISLREEASLRRPIGQMVEVNGRKMSVYVEGEGKETLVFMSGSGTASPILDFKSLYDLLTEDYRIVVVERFGYGFSDVVDAKRDLEAVLIDTRAALKAAGVEGPFILCPHSMAGIEALYWAHKYPSEVKAIIGLDMFTPAAYEKTNIYIPITKIVSLSAKLGFTRVFPGFKKSDAVDHGALTKDEQLIYYALIHSKAMNKNMVSELENIKADASKVGAFGTPQIPMLLFCSNADGISFSKDEWRMMTREFSRTNPNSKLINLECGHYVHDFEYYTISREIKDYISTTFR